MDNEKLNKNNNNPYGFDSLMAIADNDAPNPTANDIISQDAEDDIVSDAHDNEGDNGTIERKDIDEPEDMVGEHIAA